MYFSQKLTLQKFGTEVTFEEFIEILKGQKVFLNYDNKEIITNLKNAFDYYVNADGKIRKDQLKKDIIQHLPFIKHHHATIEGMIERGFSAEEAIQMLRNRNRLCLEYWTVRGYDEERAKEMISKMQSDYSKLVKNHVCVDREFIIQRGIDPDEFFKKRSVWCVEHWKSKGYSETDSEKIVRERQKELSVRSYTKPIEERRKYKTTCKEYWINKGYSEDEAKSKVSERQKTFTLEKCIEKYGEEEGLKRWEERQRKWQNTLNDRCYRQPGQSKISQKLFNKILETYTDDEKDYVFYGSKNKEFTLKNEAGYYYRYDFCDVLKRKIIEFNGDIYHGNPLMFNENDKPHPFSNKTAKEIWLTDSDKKRIAENNGFEEFVVWEKDYRKNPNLILEQCLKFLNNSQLPLS